MSEYSIIRGRFTTALLDETTTNIVPLTGQVILTAATKAVLTEENGKPVTVLPTRVTVDLDANGTMPDTEVLASDSPGASTQGFTWTAHFNLRTQDNRPVPYEAFSFSAPAGQTVDLTTVAPVSRSEGLQISRGVNGSSIRSMAVRGTTLTVTLTDGTMHEVLLPVLDPENVTVIDGEDGVDGRGISSIVDNGDATITIHYTDGVEPSVIRIPTVQGDPGLPGTDGNDGLSAYQLAVQEGFVGSLSDWLVSLEGQDGQDGITPENGTDGLSAYEIAVANGFVGSEAEWLESLKGQDGSGSTYDDTALTGRVSTLETKVNTDIPANYALKSEIPEPTPAYDDTALKGRVTTVENALPNKLDASTASSTYATKAELPEEYDDTALAGRVSAVETGKLSTTDASNTYATKTALNAKLDSATASSTYLSKTDATNTYATKADEEARPRIYTGDTAPDSPRAGDIWVQ